MFSIFGERIRSDRGINRRELLRVGGLGFTGLACADLLPSRASAGKQTQTRSQFGKAKSSIMVFNYG